MVNRHDQMVWEAFYADNKISYKSEVLYRTRVLEYMSIKQITLNEHAQLNMFYWH